MIKFVVKLCKILPPLHIYVVKCLFTLFHFINFILGLICKKPVYIDQYIHIGIPYINESELINKRSSVMCLSKGLCWSLKIPQ